MKKRLFQVLDEMNVNDEKNKTATLPCCFDMVEAKTAKGGGHVIMGVPAEVIPKIFFGEYQPMLVLLDKKEHERLKELPVEEAEQKAARYEKALKEISESNCDYESTGYVKSIHSTECKACMAKEALTPKQTNDDTVNG